MKRRPSDPPIHPFALPLLALVGTGVFGLIYWLFGVGRDAFYYLLAVLMVFALPVVIVFGAAGLGALALYGIGGLVSGIRRLFRRPK
jgi:hypothetical protein